MHKIRITKEGQTQVSIGGEWEDCSLEEFDELLSCGYKLEHEEDLLLESSNSRY